MFNALNRFIARLDGEPPGPEAARSSPHEAYGFQVLRNTNVLLPIEPFFDFIVGINGRAIDTPEPHLFAQEVRNCAGGFVSLALWSVKGQRARELRVSVSTADSSDPNTDAPALGLALQWTPLAVAANVWHVLDVPAGSPAELAGLLPYGDYIIGSPEGPLHGEGGLGELVEDHIGRPMRLHVYNNEFDVAREVTVHPSRDWGGEGALGCVLGYGALHRLPAALSEPVSGPGETMFDGDAAGQGRGHGRGREQETANDKVVEGDIVVPAEMAGIAPSSPPPAQPSRARKRDRHHHQPGNFMDDYLREEELKSLALDKAPATGVVSTPPPPPKCGPPPTLPSRAQPEPEPEQEPESKPQTEPQPEPELEAAQDAAAGSQEVVGDGEG